jgi:hypothetical protein
MHTNWNLFLTVLLIAVIIMSAINTIAFILNRKKPDHPLAGVSVLISIAASIFTFVFLLIFLFSNGGDDGSAGMYTYYVNGVRTSSGLVYFSSFIFVSFLAAAAQFWALFGISLIPVAILKFFARVFEKTPSDGKLYRNKLITILLAFFLGVFGAHDLYLHRFWRFGLRILFIIGFPVIVALSGIYNKDIIEFTTISIFAWVIIDMIIIAKNKEIKTKNITIIFDK